ncbi:response regulator (plasmid) [Methylobacterium sp. NMS12]|uniref:response regulator n=1 Tax=Methylobacterium sp. NMS12 TaxID=3079766 RepID=UPI003F88584E
MREPAPPLVGRRVLVVEDEYLIAMEVKRWLLAAGADVVGPVPSVVQALDLIEDQGTLDAAVLDVNLGGGDMVFPVADALRALGVPYLFATGEATLAQAGAHREQRRLYKPFVETELVRAIAALLG